MFTIVAHTHIHKHTHVHTHIRVHTSAPPRTHTHSSHKHNSPAHATIPTLAHPTRVDFHSRCLKVSEKHTPKMIRALPVIGLSIPLKKCDSQLRVIQLCGQRSAYRYPLLIISISWLTNITRNCIMSLLMREAGRTPRQQQEIMPM